MKKTVLLAILLCIYFACSPSSEEGAVNGQKIFKDNCIVCHGIKGNMGAAGAFDLTKSTLSLEERINVISNGRNGMTPFKSILSSEKIEAVAEYVEGLRENESRDAD